jgi:hypothetical protein
MRLISLVISSVVCGVAASSSYSVICDSVSDQIMQLKFAPRIRCLNSKLQYAGRTQISTFYCNVYQQAFCRILDDSLKEIVALKSTVEEGATIPDFGQKADQIANSVKCIY